MHIASVIPMTFCLGICVSIILLRLRDLLVPLWMGRQVIKFSGLSILALVFVGYAQM